MSTGLFSDEEDSYNLDETKYTLKVDGDDSDDLDGLEDGDFDEVPSDDDFGGEDINDEGNDDKPFDDEPFDADVDADEDDDPKRFIQQLSGKLGQSLRKYTETNGAVDYDLEKFAINSLISATHTGEMDDEDQKDIIDKIKSSGADSEGDDSSGDDDGSSTDSEGDDSSGDDDGSDLEENLINVSESLDSKNKSSILPNKDIILKKLKEHHNMDYKNFGNYDRDEYMLDGTDVTESPEISPSPVKPKEKPQIKPTRRSKPWRPSKQPSVNPKAEGNDGKVVKEGGASDGRIINTKYLDNNKAIVSVNFNDSEVDISFRNTDEVIEEPTSVGGLTIYKYESIDSPDGKEYTLGVKFSGDEDSGLSVAGVNDEYLND